MAAITNQHTNQGDKPGEYIKKKSHIQNAMKTQRRYFGELVKRKKKRNLFRDGNILNFD